MIEALKGLVDRHAVLQKTAYHLFVTAMAVKNAVYRTAYLRLGWIPYRMSDRGQDRWIASEVFPGKRGGYFVELGAFDGFSESNTFVLEKRYGWRGLCIEPNPENFRKLTEVFKRDSTAVPLAVHPEGGQLEFVLDGQRSGLVSTEGDHSNAGEVATARAAGKTRVVDARPLEEILDHYGAPAVIDYLSLDVEGLETRVMRHFPFDRYRFLAITIERPSAELNALLQRNGYCFVRNSLYDTFYIHQSLPDFDRICRKPFAQLPEKRF